MAWGHWKSTVSIQDQGFPQKCGSPHSRIQLRFSNSPKSIWSRISPPTYLLLNLCSQIRHWNVVHHGPYSGIQTQKWPIWQIWSHQGWAVAVIRAPNSYMPVISWPITHSLCGRARLWREQFKTACIPNHLNHSRHSLLSRVLGIHWYAYYLTVYW